MRVTYTQPKDAMPVLFEEVKGAHMRMSEGVKSAQDGRVYKLRNQYAGHTGGWVTFVQDGSAQRLPGGHPVQ